MFYCKYRKILFGGNLILLLILSACGSLTPSTADKPSLAEYSTSISISDSNPLPQEHNPNSTSITSEIVTPSAVYSNNSKSDDSWLVYVNESYHYTFRYPPTAKIIEEGVVRFPTDELPPDKTHEEYIAHLQEIYPGALCVSVVYQVGFINISAPPNQDNKYTLCGGFGIGDYDITKITESVFVGDTSFDATGNRIYERDPQATLRAEFLIVNLNDGTNFSYGGSWLDEGVTYEDYLEVKEDLFRILASYRILAPQ